MAFRDTHPEFAIKFLFFSLCRNIASLKFLQFFLKIGMLYNNGGLNLKCHIYTKVSESNLLHPWSKCSKKESIEDCVIFGVLTSHTSIGDYA